MLDVRWAMLCSVAPTLQDSPFMPNPASGKTCQQIRQQNSAIGGGFGTHVRAEKQIPLFARDDSEAARDDSVRRYRRTIRPGWLASPARLASLMLRKKFVEEPGTASLLGIFGIVLWPHESGG